jgi:hypothetical protein
VSRWADPNWLAEAHEWLEAQLESLDRRATGPIKDVRVMPWAAVLRVPTDRGDVYFKANTEELRHEAALVTFLAGRRPDCIPGLLAADVERGWMLMADAGVRLVDVIAQERDMTRWLDVLPLYASVQLDMVDHVDELLEVGVPDVRLGTLAARFEQLSGQLDLPPDEVRRLRDSVQWVGETSEQLAGYGIPETIQHDDFTDGQVYIRDDRYLLLDWGDACVSHPFFTMSVTLEGVIAWGVDDVQGSVAIEPFRDAYLEPFRRAATNGDVASMFPAALRLGWVCRAINGHMPADPDSTRVRLRMFLDGQP